MEKNYRDDDWLIMDQMRQNALCEKIIAKLREKGYFAEEKSESIEEGNENNREAREQQK